MPEKQRGKLKIFMGYAAGVGKTYQMLEEAQQLKSKGTDLVVGYFEPHGRPDTIKKADGLELIPRKKISYRESAFEEMDATVFFDNVLVPWERVFLLGDVDLCNNVGAATQSMAHSGHQVLTRYVVKAEFLLGLADLMVETLGSGSIPHVQEQVAELITHRDMLHACLRAAEVDADLTVIAGVGEQRRVGRHEDPARAAPAVDLHAHAERMEGDLVPRRHLQVLAIA